jgi:hypothetical protein
LRSGVSIQHADATPLKSLKTKYPNPKQTEKHHHISSHHPSIFLYPSSLIPSKNISHKNKTH